MSSKNSKKMIFAGSNKLGCKILSYLVENTHEILLVICNNENEDNRWFPSLEEPPKNVNQDKFVTKVKKLKPDIGFSIFSSHIFKEDFINIFPKGLINLHFAPLPKYRGCMPVSWSIINGEETHGVTIHYIDKGIDTGDIIAQVTFPIKDEDTGLDLYKKCESNGFKLFQSILPTIISGTNKRKVQDHSIMTYYKRTDLKSFEIKKDWSEKRKFDFVRALTFPPLKPAYMIINGKKVFITSKNY